MTAELMPHPVVFAPVFVNNPLTHVERQYLLLPVKEQRRLRAILRQAVRLDEQLATLHLMLPAVEIRWHQFTTHHVASIGPAQLLRAIALWHATQRRKYKAD